MGIYDRDYVRDDERGGLFGGQRSMVVNLILINAAVYVLDHFSNGQISRGLALRGDLLREPWNFYQLVTYGFLHVQRNVFHILFNMFGLWFFGRDIETKLGKREFLAFYLLAIVVSGLAWVLVQNATGAVDPRIPLVGASGGVTAIMLLFIIHFPQRTILFFGIVPMPAWVLGLIWFIGDLRGAMEHESKVAYSAHFAGAILALLYYRSGWKVTSLIPGKLSLASLRRGPRLRVHDPDQYEEKMGEQVDEILRKIQTHGQDSLTPKERDILEKASRRYQQKHR